MKKTANQSVEVITDILCDACGTSVVPDFQKEHHDNLNDFNQYGMLHASYGYGSSGFYPDFTDTSIKRHKKP